MQNIYSFKGLYKKIIMHEYNLIFIIINSLNIEYIIHNLNMATFGNEWKSYWQFCQKKKKKKILFNLSVDLFIVNCSIKGTNFQVPNEIKHGRYFTSEAMQKHIWEIITE